MGKLALAQVVGAMPCIVRGRRMASPLHIPILKSLSLALLAVALISAAAKADDQSLSVLAKLEQKIQQALSELPDNQRIAILLCRQDELSYEDIARVLGCSLSATKSLIHRGRETLKQKLKPYLRTGSWKESPK